MSDLKVGYIGLGNQGLPMAKRLAEWPGGLIVFDVRTEAMTPLAELGGAEMADSVADVAKADVIEVTVLNDEQVRDVVSQLAEHAKAGTVIAIHSTIEPDTAAELAEQLRPKVFMSSTRRSVAAPVPPTRVSWPSWSAPTTRRTRSSSRCSSSGRRWWFAPESPAQGRG